MSHVTTIKCEIKDLSSLIEACKKIGLEFVEGQKTYKWYGRFMGDYQEEGTDPSTMGKCEHAIRIPNNKDAYEIGVVQQGNSYTLKYDFWQGGYGLEAIAGKKCEKLINNYTQSVAIKTATQFAQAEGYTVSQSWDEEASETVITLRKYE